jgi:hypothetical protein
MTSHLEQLKLTIKNAWLTLSMLPEPDARFRRAFGSSWTLPTFRSSKDGDYPSEIYTKLIPSPHEITVMEAVFEWLTWLRGQPPDDGGEYAIKRIAAWSYGVPVFRMAQREHCSERTIYNRIDRSIAKISSKFKDVEVDIDDNEPEPDQNEYEDLLRLWGRIMAGLVLSQKGLHQRCVGRSRIFMFRGEKYKSSYDLDDKICGKDDK